MIDVKNSIILCILVLFTKDLFSCSICLLHVLCFLVLALENMKRKLIKDKIIEFNIYIRTEVLFFSPLEKGKDFTFLLQ